MTPKRFSARAAPVTRPLPLWILFPLFFVLVYLAHFTLLRLPWFWDEAGYYIPAALDFFHTGALVPTSTVTNAHPPLPSILLAGWWRLAGYHIAGTRTFLCMVAAAALLGVFRLARLLAGSMVASTVTLLTAIYPVWFAQSTMAHADLFAAAFTLWALSFAFERYTAEPRLSAPWLAALLFSLAALSKETAILTPLALGLWELTLLLTERVPHDHQRTQSEGYRGVRLCRPSLQYLLAFLLPVLPLIAWYAYHRHITGFVFGNPEFLRYNATANLSPLRVLLSLWHRLLHLTFHMNLWVPTAITGALLLAPRLAGRSVAALEKPALAAISIVLAGNLLAFSVLGGALLTRYLLPCYPLLLLLQVSVWRQRTRRWEPLAALTAAAFLAALWIDPPYSFAPEDNLTYRDFVVLHQQAIRVLNQRFPAATVLTAWPASAELAHPELGYTPKPFPVAPIENFTLEQIEHAAADPGAFDTALVFSTKWVPPPGHFSLSRQTESSDSRFYDFHRDLSPHEIATLLHGEVVWQGARNGEWAAVLHFPRIVEARAEPGAGLCRIACPIHRALCDEWDYGIDFRPTHSSR